MHPVPSNFHSKILPRTIHFVRIDRIPSTIVGAWGRRFGKSLGQRLVRLEIHQPFAVLVNTVRIFVMFRPVSEWAGGAIRIAIRT